MAKEKHQKLTPKEEGSCQDYIKTGSKVEAYRLNYSTKNFSRNALDVQANKHFNKPKIALRVQELQAKIEQEHNIDKTWIINKLKRVIDLSEEQDKPDTSGINKAIDTLNKMFGYYAPQQLEHKGEMKIGVGMGDLYKEINK